MIKDVTAQPDEAELLPAVVAMARVLHELISKLTSKGFSVVIEEPGRQVLFDSRSCVAGYVAFHAEGDAPPKAWMGDPHPKPGAFYAHKTKDSRQG